MSAVVRRMRRRRVWRAPSQPTIVRTRCKKPSDLPRELIRPRKRKALPRNGAAMAPAMELAMPPARS